MVNNIIETELRCECKECSHQWSVFNKDILPETPKKCPKCDNSKVVVIYKSCKGEIKK